MAPNITRAATFTSGTPVALATNGTVRLARGLASITKTWPALSPSRFTANWTLIRPRTSSASAKARVWPSMTAIVSAESEYGGMAQAESPECTPASSTCSMIPPITISPVWSRMASTSTSVASSRKRSTSTGRLADRPPSLPRLPNPASSSMARRSCSSSYTISMARPPST